MKSLEVDWLDFVTLEDNVNMLTQNYDIWSTKNWLWESEIYFAVFLSNLIKFYALELNYSKIWCYT